MWNLFWIYERLFWFHSDVCPRTQSQRELGFVLMALNIRKVVAQQSKIIKIYKKTISILFQ